MKFGGPSVADINCIRNVAKKVQEKYLKKKKSIIQNFQGIQTKERIDKVNVTDRYEKR